MQAKALSTVLLASIVLAAPGASAPAQEEPPVPSPLYQEYTLVVDDTIQVVVEGHEDLNQRYTVPANGEVSFPPIGRIQLRGRTVRELEEEIRGKLQQRGQLTDPTVYVIIATYAPRQAFLIGAVTRSISLPVHTRYGVMEVLSLAGAGVTGSRGVQGADLRNVTIMRKREDGETFRFTVNLEDVLLRGDFRKNVIVMSNDIIHIPLLRDEMTSAAVYILGKVNRPGRYTFHADREQMTLTKLIALAGDFHQFAAEDSIKILRKEGARTRGLEVDFDKIIDLEMQDVVLLPDDLVYVPESPI